MDAKENIFTCKSEYSLLPESNTDIDNSPIPCKRRRTSSTSDQSDCNTESTNDEMELFTELAHDISEKLLKMSDSKRTYCQNIIHKVVCNTSQQGPTISSDIKTEEVEKDLHTNKIHIEQEPVADEFAFEEKFSESISKQEFTTVNKCSSDELSSNPIRSNADDSSIETHCRKVCNISFNANDTDQHIKELLSSAESPEQDEANENIVNASRKEAELDCDYIDIDSDIDLDNISWSGSEKNSISDDKIPSKVSCKNVTDEEHLDRISQKNTFSLHELDGNLFTAPADNSLAHCVSADMFMPKGVSEGFRQKFGKLGCLLNQRQYVGGCAFLKHEKGFLYYLVTKELSTDQPKFDHFRQSLTYMKKLILSHKVTKLAVPKMGCGFDKFNWIEVKKMLEAVFADTDLKIVVYCWKPQKAQQHRICTRVVCNNYALWYHPATIVLYFLTASGQIVPRSAALMHTFNVHRDFNEEPLALGTVVRSIRYSGSCKWILYGFVVKQSKKAPFDFVHMENCMRVLHNNVSIDACDNLTLEDVTERPKKKQNLLQMRKILSLLIHLSHKKFIYISKGIVDNAAR